MPEKFLIIQTAFIGDVVLATGIIEKLHRHVPNAQIDFLLRKGNESLLKGHPYLNEILVWNKKKHKFLHLWKLLRLIRSRKYDKVINVQRYTATGLLTAFSGGGERIGFDKNPFNLFFTRRIKHIISTGNNVKHETERNNDLISHFTGNEVAKPRLYPSVADVELVKPFSKGPYITISPASVWFTKQYPAANWVYFIDMVPSHYNVYLLGALADKEYAAGIQATTLHQSVTNLCGQLSYLQSAALMEGAVMNYVNDSAPLHFASAMNAPVTAVYCSTLPSFGFGPLSDKSYIVEIGEALSCRPCGLHGKNDCPLGHFHCAVKIKEEQLLAALPLAK